jgi:hypothetical protein
MMAGREGEGPATSGTCKKINRKRKKDQKRVVLGLDIITNEVATTISSHLPMDSLPTGLLHIAYSTSANKKKKEKKRKNKNYSTEYSHVVPHHSTDSAINCLTAQIGRDAVGLVVYGRSSKVINFFGLLTCLPFPSGTQLLSALALCTRFCTRFWLDALIPILASC